MRKEIGIPRDFFGGEQVQSPEPARRPVATDEAKVQVTIYLSEAAAMALEKMRYTLMLEHGVKTSKSAIAQYAIEAAAKDVEGVARGLTGEP